MDERPTIFVIDDNKTARESLARLLQASGFRVEPYSSAQLFLEDYDPARPGCLVLDIRMPGMTGLELQERLDRKGFRIPIIIMSGHATVENVVRAIKGGAVDFIKKPYRAKVLLERIRQALEADARIRGEQAERAELATRLALLSPREREVMDLLAEGKSAKDIAARFGLNRKTVDLHRAHLMDKLQANSVVDLVRIAQACAGHENARDRNVAAHQPMAGADMTLSPAAPRPGRSPSAKEPSTSSETSSP